MAQLSQPDLWGRVNNSLQLLAQIEDLLGRVGPLSDQQRLYLGVLRAETAEMVKTLEEIRARCGPPRQAVHAADPVQADENVASIERG